MITAKTYLTSKKSDGRRVVAKGVAVELRDDATGFCRTEGVSVAAGDAWSEQKQLDRAVPHLMKRWGLEGEWRWSS